MTTAWRLFETIEKRYKLADLFTNILYIKNKGLVCVSSSVNIIT